MEVAEASEAMREALSCIQLVNACVGKLTKVSEFQITGLADLSDAVTHLDEVTHQVAVLIEQLTATTSNLDQQSKALPNTVAVFKT